MKGLFAKLFGNARRTSRPSLTQRHQARLQIEGLESRQLMSASPIAAPLAKPILPPHALVQSITQPIAAQSTLDHQRTASGKPPLSPLTYNAYLGDQTAWGDNVFLQFRRSSRSILLTLQQLNTAEKRMELWESMEPYYEHAGYDGRVFQHYVNEFNSYYHNAVREASYWLWYNQAHGDPR